MILTECQLQLRQFNVSKIFVDSFSVNDVLSEKRLKEIKSSRRKLYQTELRAPEWEKYVDYNE